MPDVLSGESTHRVRVEYCGQLVTGYVLRSCWFMRRVRLDTEDGYFLAWVPKWRVHDA
jgi:hypothetical protein